MNTITARVPQTQVPDKQILIAMGWRTTQNL